MNMSHGFVIAMVLEDVHSRFLKLIVYRRPKKMWNIGEFK
jgi:hypothetical protein